jgi:tRNA pseudouridine38-40 synthase
MRNFKLEIEYDGTRYYGWQVQNGLKAKRSYRSSRTIQHILESKLKKILQEDIGLIVAGRTDAGVHALAQVANFKSSSKMPLACFRMILKSPGSNMCRLILTAVFQPNPRPTVIAY